jgi:hypothetical protein
MIAKIVLHCIVLHVPVRKQYIIYYTVYVLAGQIRKNTILRFKCLKLFLVMIRLRGVSSYSPFVSKITVLKNNWLL